jgi:hypothetical protein
MNAIANKEDSPSRPLRTLHYLPGRDEMNLAELPLVLLAERPTHGVDRIEYQDDYRDPVTGEIRTLKVTITADHEHGLPTIRDEDVLLVLFSLTKEFLETVITQHPEYISRARTLCFSRHQLLLLLGWPIEGKSYLRLATALERWKGVKIKYENWWHPLKQSYGTEIFSFLDNVSLYDERKRSNRSASAGQMDLPLSSVTWNEVPFASLRYHHLKPLDLERLFRLPTAAAKRAYRYLDKHLPDDGAPLTYDLHRFACQRVGLSPNYKPSRLVSEVQTTVIDPLENAAFLKPMNPKERYLKQQRGRYQITLARTISLPLLPPADAIPEPSAADTGSSLLDELRRRKLGGKVARDLVAAHPAEYLRQKIEYFDYQLETGSLKRPAAWLRKAIEEDFGEPAGYLPRAERERQHQAAEEKQQTAAEIQRRQHERREAERRREQQEIARRKAERAHINAYLKTLTPQEQHALEQQALAHGEDKLREAAQPSCPTADVALRLLVDREVLRIHPLPEPPAAS